ncbi:hypothetical protein [Micromonospora echinospora]|uniref:hypothetical protein n=1 Tax=Micromonospora echinospora TaxID=1877 RepID=UPI003A87C729
MTPEALETLLAGVPSGRLDLPVTALDPPAANYLGRFVPTGRLLLTGCTRSPPPARSPSSAPAPGPPSTGPR